MHLQNLFVVFFLFHSLLTDIKSEDLTKELPLSRKVRQTFSGGSGGSPIFARVFSRLPTSNALDTAICFQLTRQVAPAGCAFVRNVVDSLTGSVGGCRMECSGPVDQFAEPQPSQRVAGFLSADAPYLLNGQFQVLDQSNIDMFVGESYGVISNPTTSTVAPMMITTTTTAPGGTQSSSTTTTTSTTASTTTTSRPLTAQQLEDLLRSCLIKPGKSDSCTFNPIDDSCGTCCRPTVGTPTGSCNFGPNFQQIATCINLKQPASGCSFNNAGNVAATTCGLVCPLAPAQFGPVLPEGGPVFIAPPPLPTN